MEASLGLHVRPSSGYRSDLRSSTNHRVAIRRLPGSLLDRRRTTLLLLKAINGKGDDARELDLVEKAEKLFDETLKDQRKLLKEQAENDEQIRLQVEAMRAQGSPEFMIRFVEWGANLSKSIRVGEEKRLREMESSKEEYIKALKQLDDKLDNMEPLEVEDFKDYIATGEDAPQRATSIVVSAFFSATLLSWVSSWFGIEVGTLIHDPAVPTVADLTTWLAWTVPYVGATAAAGAVAAPWIGNRGTFRYMAEDSFFGKLHPTAILSLAASLGYSQSIVYQGVWMLTFLRFFSGDSGAGGDYLLDPSAADEVAVQQAMGGLVAARGLGALIAVPAAVLSAAAVESAYFVIKESISYTAQDAIKNGKGVVVDSETGFEFVDLLAKFADSLPDKNSSVDDSGASDANSESSTSTTPTSTPSTTLTRPEFPSLENFEMSTEEFWLTLGRVFAASVWLGTETLVTGNLWMTIGTSSLGIALGMGTRREKARAAARTDS